MGESILIVEDSPNTIEHLNGIMDFMGFDSIVHADVENIEAHFGDDEKVTLVLLGACGAKDIVSVYRDLRQQSSHVPIIQIIDVDNKPRFSQELDSGCISKLDLPLHYNQLEMIN